MTNMIKLTQFAAIAFIAAVTSTLVVAADTELRALSDFTAIELESGIDADIHYAEVFEVAVTAPDQQLEDIVTERDGSDTLVVRLRKGADSSDQYSVSVTLPMLTSFSMQGSGEASIGDFTGSSIDLSVQGSGDIAVGSLEFETAILSVSGSGDIAVDLLQAESVEANIAGLGAIEISQIQADNMSALIAGSGDMSLAGVVTDLNVKIAGSGDIDGRDLRVENLDGVIAGSGDVDIDQVANDNLTGIGTDIRDLVDLGLDIGVAVDRMGIEHWDDQEEHGNRFGRGFRGESSEGSTFGGIGLWLTGFAATVLSLGMPIIIVALIVTYSYRKKRMEHETLRQFAESDKPIPENMMDSFSPKQAANAGLRSGAVLVALGAGIAVFLISVDAGGAAALGCIPGFVGLAKLAIWKLENKHTQTDN